MFAVDGSDVLSSEQFRKLKNTIKKILDSYSISSTGTHVGVIEFSDRSHEKIYLTESYKRQDIYAMIDGIEQSRGDRRVTDGALKMAAERMFSVNFGGRVGAARALVLLTAGRSTGELAASEAVKPLVKNGVRVYVVSVGDKVDGEEVRGMVPSDDNVFPTTPDDPGEVVGELVEVLNKDIKDREYLQSL